MTTYLKPKVLLSLEFLRKYKLAVEIFIGSFFIIACSKVCVPTQPVPFTFQELGIFFLAIAQGGKKASCSTLLFLIWATIGMPVLAYGSDPLWIFGPRAGYLLAFPLAALVVGTLLEGKESPSLLKVVVSILSGQGIIYFLGALFLTPFVGVKMSISLGIFPFLPFSAFKLMIICSLTKNIKHLKNSLGLNNI